MTLCDHLAVRDIYNPQLAPVLAPRPLPQAWCDVPPPLAMGEEADRSQQQAQLVKIQHKEETSQFRANKNRSLFRPLHSPSVQLSIFRPPLPLCSTS